MRRIPAPVFVALVASFGLCVKQAAAGFRGQRSGATREKEGDERTRPRTAVFTAAMSPRRFVREQVLRVRYEGAKHIQRALVNRTRSRGPHRMLGVAYGAALGAYTHIKIANGRGQRTVPAERPASASATFQRFPTNRELSVLNEDIGAYLKANNAPRSFWSMRELRERFPWITPMESPTNWGPAATEVESVLLRHWDEIAIPGNRNADEFAVTDSPHYKKIPLLGLAGPTGFVDVFPKTWDLVKNALPDSTQVYLSIIRPGFKIPEHNHVRQGRLRIHLNLVIPPGQSTMTVGDVSLGRYPGQVFAFRPWVDHSSDHAPPIEGPAAFRAVLLIDVPVPLPHELHQRNTAEIQRLASSWYALRIAREEEKWARRLRAQVNLGRRKETRPASDRRPGVPLSLTSLTEMR